MQIATSLFKFCGNVKVFGGLGRDIGYIIALLRVMEHTVKDILGVVWVLVRIVDHTTTSSGV